MKTIYLVLSSAIVIFGFTFLNQSSEYIAGNQETGIRKLNLHCPEYSPVINAENKKADSKEIDQSWYQKAIENIEKDEYNITYSEELGAYQSPNRANNIRFIYDRNGFTAKNRSDKIPLFDVSDKSIKDEDKRYEKVEPWEVKLQITNYELRMNEEIVAVDNKAHIENEKIRIDYTNTKDGMRQDFIVKNKPEGEGKLRLNLSADTKLKMIVGADALMFKDKDGIDRMKYSALKCWDANGRELRAYFEKDNYELRISNYELESKSLEKEKIRNSKFVIPNSFSIVVNDEDAVYPITIDPLSTSPSWTAESNQASALFGISVSTAGDVNGDGFSDVIVGAYNYDNGQTSEGRAFVYHGSESGLSATANWTAESNQSSAGFGYSVSTAGDVNGDGYSDVIVGAHFYSNGQASEGRAYVYHGSASGLSITANWTAESNQANAYFGYSVSTAGDVNGDGRSDVIVGAYGYDNGQSDEGRAYVYHGSASGLSATANWTAENNSATTYFGYSVSTAGDVNGDGFSDVLVSAPFYDGGQTDEGIVFVYHGSPSGLSFSFNWAVVINQAYAYFGYSVSTAGDVNGDGYSDVIVGAVGYNNGQADEGSAYVYHGSATGLSATANWTAESNQATANFGNSVSTAGDVNGDGYSDVIVGAPAYDNGQTDEGRAFVYHGSATGLSPTANWTAESDQADARFGNSVSTAGDVNGDGYSDVIVGAYLYHNGQSQEGRAYVYHGSASGLSTTANFTKAGTAGSDNLGSNVSSAGDVNGDGFSDVLISAPYFDGGQTDEGIVYLFGGAVNGLNPIAFASIEGNQDSAFFGESASTAGDVNGDGYCDVIIGSPFYDNGQSNEGRAYIYFGSALTPYLTLNTSVESNQADANFGTSVSTAGDVNGDGYSDVIVGSDLYDNGQTGEGKAFVYYGSATGISINPNWTTESDQSSAQLGNAVSTAGDVNGDGYSDILVGSSYYDNGNSDEGRVSVYFGSANGLSTIANWTGESDQNSGRLGFSLSTAGDVNGDGFADILAGAVLYNNGSSNEGGIFLWYGSATGPVANGTPSNADWSAESDQAFAQLGWSVSTAGDVNGDGYSDIIAGARLYENGEANEGGAFCWHGSPSGLGADGTPSNADWSAESDQAAANFGISVSTAGDVNGDGYSDVIIGAERYDNGFTDNGQVFVYYGNGGNGLKAAIRQYKPGTTNILYSGGLTGTNNQVRLNVFGKSSYGRADGKIVYEYKDNGVPFSGTTITNSTSSSGSGTNTDLGTTGIQLNNDISGLLTTKEYKWRARVQYNLVNNPFQKFGPWKYYTNYIPVPFGCFKAITIDNDAPAISYTALTDTAGGGTRTLTGVTITDASGVNGTSGSRPRVYYKVKSDSNVFNDNTNATDGWKFSEATNSSSPFGFLINYSLLNGSISVFDTIQYFVIAQDVRTFGPLHVGINSGTFAAAPYNDSLTSAAFPITGTIKSYKITDNVAPAISFVNITDTASLNNRNFTNVTITDASGVNGTAGTRPRVYYKKINNLNEYNDNTNATQGWKYTEASGSSSPFDFVINYSLIFGGLQTSDTLEYFVVAQDNASTPNVQIVQGTFASPPASVNLTSAAFPIGDTLKSYKIIDLGPPSISYINLNDTASLSNRAFNNVVITDSSGVAGGTGNRPRVYFKRKTDANTFNDNTNATAGWKYNSASGNTSPFSFTINYNRLNGSIAEGDTIEYFVVAQDKYIPPFVAINSGTFAASPSSVALTSAAFPISGTINSFAILSPPQKFLNLTLLIQGFYNAGSNTLTPDTVRVYLRAESSPYAIIDSAKTYVGGPPAGSASSSLETGMIDPPGAGQYKFNNASNNVPYYLQVKHRNSIETWSADTMSFSNSLLTYVFSDLAQKAFGDNMIQVDTSPIYYAIYGGDVNQDGVIDATDAGAVDNDAANFETGYLPTDLNGDEVIDASDAALVDNNAANFVSAVVP